MKAGARSKHYPKLKRYMRGLILCRRWMLRHQPEVVQRIDARVRRELRSQLEEKM